MTAHGLDQAGRGDSVPVRLKLSALWASTMFIYAYVDIISFYRPGVIRDILAGRVSEFDITQAWALGALALLAIPSLMVAGSLTLSARVTRWANIIVGCLFAVVSVGNVVGESWMYLWLGAAIELVLIGSVVSFAWRWQHAD